MRVCIALIDATASVFIANYHLNRIGVVGKLPDSQLCIGVVVTKSLIIIFLSDY